ncbi:hypothetical protein SO694_00055053 [Aureococcus anophagefferens]|uniref:Uncharacterized protein n=1 Tax=Aureococcus anophagefferens TaxID=44056 RepID=A0ABR1FXC2_AURAN
MTVARASNIGDEAGIDVVIEATAADVYYALPYALFALRRRGRGFVGSITVSYAAAERRDFAKLEKVFPASPGNGTRRDVPSIVLPDGASAGAWKEPHAFDGPVLREEGCGATPPANGRPARRTSRPPSRPPGPAAASRPPSSDPAPPRGVGLDATPVLYVDAAPKIVAQYGALAPRLSFTKSKAARVETLEQYVAYLAKRGGRDPFSRVPGGVGRLSAAGWTRAAQVWGPFAGSEYADHLRAWFAALAPSQFAVVPFRYLDDDPPRRSFFPGRKRTERAPPPPLAPRDAANESALDFTLRRLGLPLPETRAVDCIALNRRRGRRRRGPRARALQRALAEDDALSPASAAALAKLVAAHVSPLKVARVLAGAPGEEPPRLFAFRGDAKDPDAVADWLARSW